MIAELVKRFVEARFVRVIQYSRAAELRALAGEQLAMTIGYRSIRDLLESRTSSTRQHYRCDA